MKEKLHYKRFDLFAFLAIVGCAGMLLFEGVFIFELYDRAASQPQSPLPARAAPAVSQTPRSLPIPPAVAVPVAPVIEKPAPAETNAPPVTNAVSPEIQTVPAAAPVG